MKTFFKLFTIWMLVVIIFFAMQMVIFYTTSEINTAANYTLNISHQTTVSGHMLRITDIFQIIMTIFVIGFGGASLLALGIDIREKRIGGDQFYER